jgi:hypothetical protein
MGLVGWQYLVAAAPVMPHVEYAGMIPYLERLAARFGDRDLVLVESRDAGSDTHVFALPLAYIYGRHVLVLSSPRPDKMHLRAFLEDSQSKYDRIFFVGGGGTDLLSRHIAAVPVAGEKIQVPEYASAVARARQFQSRGLPTGVLQGVRHGIYQSPSAISPASRLSSTSAIGTTSTSSGSTQRRRLARRKARGRFGGRTSSRSSPFPACAGRSMKSSL